MKTDMRRELARQPFEPKIRQVGLLIRLAAKIKAERSAPMNKDEEAALLTSLDEVASDLTAGKGMMPG